MLLRICLILFVASFGFAEDFQIVHFPITTADDSPGTEVQVYSPTEPSRAYRIRLECVNEAGRTMKMSRLIDYSDRGQTPVVVLSAKFETGICTVKKITVEELGPVKATEKTY